MKFAFAGTPSFGAWVLGDLLDRDLVPELVVSQPDSPTGRGRRVLPPPVVVAASEAGLPVVQTSNINDETVQALLAERRVDLVVVAAFGQLLRARMLDRFLCVNVHASLLPSYRGAAPIARALMDGVTDTGVCIMRMTPGLDEGPVADRTRISVGPADTAGELGRSLALLGAIGIGRLFTGLGDGTVNWTEQEGAVTYAAKLGASDRIFDPTLAVRRLHDRVRALSPDAGCDAVTDGGMRLKIWRTWHESTEQEAERSPGRCRFEDERLVVDCSDGRLAVLALQPAGKRVMSSAEFFRGYHDRVGQHLGPAHAGREEE